MSRIPDRHNHFIAGKNSEPRSGRWRPSFDPCTAEPLTEIADGDEADVDVAVQAAHDAWGNWRDLRPGDRGRVLTSIARAIRENREELASLERADTGKPHRSALVEIEGSARYFEYYGGLADAIGGETIDLGAGYHSYTRREPFGVVGIILPWNVPLNQAARATAPALAAGNAVVAKPSEETSLTALALASLAVDCGLPPGVLNVVTGTGGSVGEAIVRHDLVRMVAFTGSVATGRRVAQIAAARIIPITLELGGKSPNIVFDDAPLKAAAEGVVRAFTVNAGQICSAGTRLLAHRSIYERLVEQVSGLVDLLPVGPNVDNPAMGPSITRAQFQKVKDYRDIAVTEGARAATKRVTVDGGGWFTVPTVYRDVTPGMRVAREEIFGPVLVSMAFEDEDEAVRIANDSAYGLAAGIWTRDLSRAHRVAARLEAGQVYVNEYLAGGVETPFGGYKDSGIGREKGREALRHYTQIKSVTVKL